MPMTPDQDDEDPIPAPPLPPPSSQFEEFVRQNPLGAVIGAVVLGVLVGKVVL